jgi:hypothetical protein
MTRNFSLLLNASNWAGLAVACHFTGTADGTPLDAVDDTALVLTIPDGTREVQVTATPKAPSYWPTTVSLSFTTDGFLTADSNSSALVQLAAAGGSGAQLAFANILVSRFSDVTAAVLGLLNQPPTERELTDRRTNPPTKTTVRVSVLAANQNIYGAWPPRDWDLHDVPDAHFLDVATPVTSRALNFAKDPSLTIDVDSVVLKLAGVNSPQLFAVTWPKAIAPKEDADPTPILLFVRQGCGQNVDAGYFAAGKLDPYPNNFDYANTCLFQNLHYGQDPLQLWGSKGVPYQVAHAGINVVTVIPCNSAGPEFGVLNDTEETGKILEELQAFMFWRAGVQVPPKSVGKTAIAAFSSGNDYLKKWLSSPANRQGNFLSNTVSAVYFLDPRPDVIDPCIAAALLWAGGADRDKRIRLYTRKPSPSHAKLLGSAPPTEPYVRNSPDDRRSASEVSLASWTRTLANIFGGSPSLDWQYVHHTIAATMLTHALAQGDF